MDFLLKAKGVLFLTQGRAEILYQQFLGGRLSGRLLNHSIPFCSEGQNPHLSSVLAPPPSITGLGHQGCSDVSKAFSKAR